LKAASAYEKRVQKKRFSEGELVWKNSLRAFLFLFEIFLYWCLHYLVHRAPSKDNTGVVETSTIRRGLVKPVNLSSR